MRKRNCLVNQNFTDQKLSEIFKRKHLRFEKSNSLSKKSENEN